MIIQNNLEKVNILKKFFKILGRNENDIEILSTGIDSKYQKEPKEETINISEIQKFFQDKNEDQKIKQFGVFFCPNKIVNKRGNDNVIKINALFCDIDVKDQNQETKNIILDRILNSNISPSIIIKTKSGFHCYWPTNEISLEEFDRYQNALHEYLNKNFLKILNPFPLHSSKMTLENFLLASGQELEIYYLYKFSFQNNFQFDVLDILFSLLEEGQDIVRETNNARQSIYRSIFQHRHISSRPS